MWYINIWMEMWLSKLLNKILQALSMHNSQPLRKSLQIFSYFKKPAQWLLKVENQTALDRLLNDMWSALNRNFEWTISSIHISRNQLVVAQF